MDCNTLRKNTMRRPARTILTSLWSPRIKRRATGALAVLFVWLSVLAPALHQHNRTLAGSRTTSTVASFHAGTMQHTKTRSVASVTASAQLSDANDLCALCDYLTATGFAPPPVLAGLYISCGAGRAPPVVFAAFSVFSPCSCPVFSPRGPPALA